MFCATCGTILRPLKTEFGKWMSCPEGHSQPELKTSTETIVRKNNFQGKRIEVADDSNILAVHDYICKHCGYGKAEMLEIGAFYADEDNVVQMKCEKCRKVSRLEGKVT